ncbi:MAG: hypothetical protein QM736_14970 [Vicinamibacterales bacterium]
MPVRLLRIVLLVVCLHTLAPVIPVVWAQPVRGPVVPPPIAPSTIARNDAGQATVRAQRLPRPIQLVWPARRRDLQLDPSDRRLHPAGAGRRGRRNRADSRVGLLRRAETST